MLKIAPCAFSSLIRAIRRSEMIAAPSGRYPEVSPFAHVMMSGTMPKTGSEAKKCPSRPKPVTTSSEM